MSRFLRGFMAMHAQCQAATDEQQFFAIIAEQSRRLGFDCCCYGVRAPRTATHAVIRVFADPPAPWLEPGLRDGFATLSLDARSDLLNGGVVRWHLPWGSGNAACQVELGSGPGPDGVVQFSWGMHGEMGLLGLARSAGAISRAEFESLTWGMGMLSHYVHAGMSRLGPHEAGLSGFAQLTAREREVLLWTAEGKAADEVGVILGISARTVNFHIYNCLEKTACRNKVQAALMYVLSGGGI